MQVSNGPLQAEDQADLLALLAACAALSGQSLFDGLTRTLAETLRVRCVFLRRNAPGAAGDGAVLSAWCAGARTDRLTIDPASMPWSMAVPLRAAGGECLGELTLRHDRPPPLEAALPPLLELLATRVSVELERLDLQRRLEAQAADFTRRHEVVRHDLGERVKELTILHRGAQILADDARPAEHALRDLVLLMPPAWQYPEVSEARIVTGDIEVTTPGFTLRPWLQQAHFTTSNGQTGVLQLVYLEPRPAEAIGPFLTEEQSLIESLAQMVCAALDRRLAWQEVRRINADLERRVARRTADLDAARKSLETFAYSVAHDLKAPLRGIDGYSRLLLEDYGQLLDGEGRTFLHNIRSVTQRMNQLIDDLLAYSRMERRAFSTSSIALHGFVHDLVAERRADLEAGRVDLTIALACDSVLADGDALGQALRNYLDNALKFTRSEERAVIEIGAAEVGPNYRFWVRDNGIGFDMKYHDRIFNIFERLHHTEEHPGTGIGLAIVRKALERMGGRAWAESAPGTGATFLAEIPNPHAPAASV